MQTHGFVDFISAVWYVFHVSRRDSGQPSGASDLPNGRLLYQGNSQYEAYVVRDQFLV